MEMESVIDIEVDAFEAKEGLSAYEVYVKNGGTLSEEEWLASLKGDPGKDGKDGEQGPQGVPGSIKIIPVTELPTENIDTAAIYLIPSEEPDEENQYKELVYINGKWEPFGNGGAKIDLTGYATEEYVDDLVANAGSDVPIYYCSINKTLSDRSSNVTSSNGQEMLDLMSELFTKIYNQELTAFKVIVRSVKADSMAGYLWVCDYTVNSASASTQKTTYQINCIAHGCASVYTLPIHAKGTWTDNVFTCTSISSNPFYEYARTDNVLMKSNTTSFTPTGDYHPATKKYVDDTVASNTGGLPDTSMYNLVYAEPLEGEDYICINDLEARVNYILPKNVEIGIRKADGTFLACKGDPDINSTVYMAGLRIVAFVSTTDILDVTSTTTYALLKRYDSPEYYVRKLTVSTGSLYSPGSAFDSGAIVTKGTLNGQYLTNYLSKTNTSLFTPTSDYHPATKKYVDETVANSGDYVIFTDYSEWDSSDVRIAYFENVLSTLKEGKRAIIFSTYNNSVVNSTYGSNIYASPIITDIDLTSYTGTLYFKTAPDTRIEVYASTQVYNYRCVSRITVTLTEGVVTSVSVPTETKNSIGMVNLASQAYVDDAIAALKAELTGGTE